MNHPANRHRKCPLREFIMCLSSSVTPRNDKLHLLLNVPVACSKKNNIRATVARTMNLSIFKKKLLEGLILLRGLPDEW